MPVVFLSQIDRVSDNSARACQDDIVIATWGHRGRAPSRVRNGAEETWRQRIQSINWKIETVPKGSRRVRVSNQFKWDPAQNKKDRIGSKNQCTKKCERNPLFPGVSSILGKIYQEFISEKRAPQKTVKKEGKVDLGSGTTVCLWESERRYRQFYRDETLWSRSPNSPNHWRKHKRTWGNILASRWKWEKSCGFCLNISVQSRKTVCN